jgi:hypothetical protein
MYGRQFGGCMHALLKYLDEAQDQTAATITEEHGTHDVGAHFCYSTVVEAMKKVALHHKSRSVETSSIFKIKQNKIYLCIYTCTCAMKNSLFMTSLSL